MVKELFSLYLQAGIFGSIFIAAILVARLFLRKAPRRILCIVWLLAALRLLVPFQIESAFSLQPEPLFPATGQGETIIPSFSNPDTPPDIIQNTVAEPAIDYLLIVSILWGAVACGFALYEVISYLTFKAKVRDAIQQPDGTKESANINNAFLVGLFRPVVYLPTGLTPQERELIISHEKTHIAHGDNWWKILSFLCLCLHWYNPFVWLSFHFFNKDIELACDEKVVRNLDVASRKAYSAALLSFGKRSCVPYLPSSSFGKVNLKQRLLYILSYKRPRLWMSVVAVLLTVVIAVCFLTSPRQEVRTPPQDLQASDTPTETQSEEPTEDKPVAPPVTVPPTTVPPATVPPTTVPPTTVPPTTAPPATEPPITMPPKPTIANIEDVSLDEIDAAVTAYAASLGFQTLDSHPNSNVKSFTPYFGYATNSDLLNGAYQAVDLAYRYCLREQHPISSTVLWVSIGTSSVYNATVTVYCAV